MGSLPIWLSTVILGFGTVFVGLIVLIFICIGLSVLCRPKAAVKSKPVQPAPEKAPDADRGALIAAVSAALAESMGTNVTGIRILSVKKMIG